MRSSVFRQILTNRDGDPGIMYRLRLLFKFPADGVEIELTYNSNPSSVITAIVPSLEIQKQQPCKRPLIPPVNEITWTRGSQKMIQRAWSSNVLKFKHVRYKCHATIRNSHHVPEVHGTVIATSDNVRFPGFLIFNEM